LEGDVLTLLGLNKELRDTLNELERYCLVSSVYLLCTP
jgi:hypothetical protein